MNVIQEECKHQGAWVYFIKLNRTLEVACRPNQLPHLNLTQKFNTKCSRSYSKINLLIYNSGKGTGAFKIKSKISLEAYLLIYHCTFQDLGTYTTLLTYQECTCQLTMKQLANTRIDNYKEEVIKTIMLTLFLWHIRLRCF